LRKQPNGKREERTGEQRTAGGGAGAIYISRKDAAGEIVGSSERAMVGLACKAEGHERTACLSVAVRDERSISPKVLVFPPVR